MGPLIGSRTKVYRNTPFVQKGILTLAGAFTATGRVEVVRIRALVNMRKNTVKLVQRVVADGNITFAAASVID